jgi:hypothetical protein
MGLMRLLPFALVAAALATAPAAVTAQTPDSLDTGLRVFLDCQRCDEDYLRTEIDFVDWVRDRQVADIHVLVSTQNTGAGGTEYTMRFVGNRAFAGVDDELRHATGPNDSEDQQRRGIARLLQAGFVRYAARSGLAQRLDFSLDDDDEDRPQGARATRDPWNAWVFEARLGANLQREASQRESEFDLSAEASQTTPNWKTEIELSTRYSRDDRQVRGNWIENLRRDHEFESLMVRSLSSHWSIGGTTSANHSTFQNRDLALRAAPALEFNVFPYSESTRRSLTLLYSVGANRITYLEETLFGKMRENLVDQSLQAAFDMRQPWGSVDFEVEGSHYFHDFEKYRLQANGGIEVNLFRGLSLDLFMSAQRIHDQLHLPGGDRTPEEILLEQRELATAYRYGGFVGVSYSFGSIFNSVVNPRMRGAGGGGGGGDFD